MFHKLFFKDSSGNQVAEADLRELTPQGGSSRWTLKLINGPWYDAIHGANFHTRGSLFYVDGKWHLTFSTMEGQQPPVDPLLTQGMRFQNLPLVEGSYPVEIELYGDVLSETFVGSVTSSEA